MKKFILILLFAISCKNSNLQHGTHCLEYTYRVVGELQSIDEVCSKTLVYVMRFKYRQADTCHGKIYDGNIKYSDLAATGKDLDFKTIDCALINQAPEFKGDKK